MSSIKSVKPPRWWRVDAAVIAHRWWEMLLMRAGLAALLWLETDWVLKSANQGTPPNPEGLALLPGAAFFTQPEVGAFLALISRRWSFGYGLALIGLHLSISLTMNLHFDIHMWLIAIFLVNLPGVMYLFKSDDPQAALAEKYLLHENQPHF